jgi:putative membrane protein
VHQGVFAIPSVDVPPVRLWAFNIGFYNLFIAGGLIAGVIIWINGNESVGRAYVIYLCLFAFLAGIALFASDRLALSRPREWRGVGPGCATTYHPCRIADLIASIRFNAGPRQTSDTVLSRC